MFTNIKIGKENFVVIPEKEYKTLIKKGFSADITGARPLTESELEKISLEIKNDLSKGIKSDHIALLNIKH